ncbi:MAG TPA: plastocyanin/azurin family copper-binding protein [Gemmatimonadales bacterium]|nr:plastocyanin/azurin family copper-binding protein [Gemmatimonadales bacterium]
MQRRALLALPLGVALLATLAAAAPARAQGASPRPASPRQAPTRRAPPARPSVRTVEIVLREITPRETYRFEPAEVVVRPGDRLRFRVASGRTHEVVFRGEQWSERVRAAWNAALPDRMGDLTSPLLVLGDRPYDVVVPDVPPGRYEFFCLPKLAFTMEGAIRVQAR